MIKAALFDLDGTLLNRDASLYAYVNRQYDRMHDWLGHIPKESYMKRFIELDQRGYVWKDKVFKHLIEEFSIPDITWEELLDDYLLEFKNSCKPFPHLHDMLAELKENDIKLGMITNGYGRFQMDNILSLDIEEYFDEILISEWEGVKKPAREIFRRACERLSVKPMECIFIGDNPENDVYGAQRAGMKGVWKKDHEWGNANRADFVIDDLMELTRYIRSLD
ncbi:HAD-IA family hydrolase (plasmid) [Cytobacillus spongiae]|uniref:HAD family hydrolase n=1 Tax=Cytobacillus spongiae TaxID=2901381 RepID=UPI001CD4E61F|nr:HAD-IA family hydrolase [Cytobacillus spongiae]MCA1062644.1 HAD-IA family hydrolase [Rossellomorea aquimaris]UII58281.1 HAD-IA family hydrolase [Cytobacillus spongiae]WJV28690.1 HAD-IA family hydrolase [Rossellomorea sp. AcN35-11]